MIICDTAPIVAAALYKDPDHHRCVELFTVLRLANRQLLVPSVAFTLLPTAESRPYRWAVRQPSA